MSVNRQYILDEFIEHQRENFYHLLHNLTLYYNDFRLHLSSLSEKTNQRYLYLTVLISLILLTILSFIIFEYRRLLKYIQNLFRYFYSYNQYILLRIRRKFFQKTTSSFLNSLFNCKSHFREKIFNEFIRSINEEFLNRQEQLSVETLQFANAKIRDVSQTNNDKNSETPADKIIINAVLDIDHLTLNIINTFKKQHFSLETRKVSGQLYILLVINPNQYSIEANLQQLHIHPVNIIDPNNILLPDEKLSIVKLLDEVVNRTTVRCSFRLSDNQEDINYNTLQNSFVRSCPDSNKLYSSTNQQSTSSIQTVGSRTHEVKTTRYQPSEPLPTVIINDIDQYSYTNESVLDRAPKRLLVRIVKAVKLHDVEQPYCILELNHPRQVKKTDIAKNGLNPFWAERFVFECDDKSTKLSLQIIDHKKATNRVDNDYIDSVYTQVSIPFTYVTSTIYQQDIQIDPQDPESVIRLEFSTLSEEEILTEANKLEQDYHQRYQQLSSNDFSPASYDTNALPKHFGLSSSFCSDDNAYISTLPRSGDIHPNVNSFSQPSSLTPCDASLEYDKPHKSKSFMSSLKHLTLPRRKNQNKGKMDTSMTSQTSSISQLSTSIQLPKTNPVSHSLSSEYYLGHMEDVAPIRRSRSISRSFRNLFRSSSKKKANVAKADALGEYENGTHNFVIDNPNFLSTSTPTPKKLSFLQRRKSKQKAKEEKHYSANSLSSYDYSRMESVRDTPVRANVGYPVTMSKQM